MAHFRGRLTSAVSHHPDTLDRTIMADKRARKGKLPFINQLIRQAKQMLVGGSGVKKSTPVHFEFSTDQVTSFRNCKGT